MHYPRAPLRRSPLSASPCPSSTRNDCASSRKFENQLFNPKATPAVVHELYSTSVQSVTSNARLPEPVSPSSGITSPLAGFTKRQKTDSFRIRAANGKEFVPPHLMSAQTRPSHFVDPEDGGSVSSCCANLLPCPAACQTQAFDVSNGFLGNYLYQPLLSPNRDLYRKV